jgi:hypothetical protein
MFSTLSNLFGLINDIVNSLRDLSHAGRSYTKQIAGESHKDFLDYCEDSGLDAKEFEKILEDSRSTKKVRTLKA